MEVRHAISLEVLVPRAQHIHLFYQTTLQNPYLLLGYQLEINTPLVFHAVLAPGPYLLD